jgi:asparagine synthase (glutamine-hydrolysing)
LCGIAGIVSGESSTRIEAMTRALAHRGPDGEGYYRDANVALGHRRLSIVDVAGGRQPISNEDDTLVLVCNGEIYNSPALRADLLKAGHRFKTATDVEVILHLYEEFGLSCVPMLRGMFAFALWDVRERRLVLARDHMGQKPLFYGASNGRFVFASEPKAVLASGVVAPEIDLEGLWHYISLRYLPDRKTLFRGVAKLPAGSTLSWCDGRIDTHVYWQPDFRKKTASSEAEIVDQLDSLLRSTVALHTLSDVEVGTFLSGGIDSSTVAAMLAAQSSAPVKSFSIGVEEQGFDELPYAAMVAQRYSMNAQSEVVRADLIRLVPPMVYYMDEPADPFAAGVFLASRLAARHVKVVLSGDGGDENFAGYDRYLGQRLIDLYALVPRWLRAGVMKHVADAIPESFGYKSLAQKVRWLNDLSLCEPPERYAQSLSYLRFRPEHKELLFSAAARAAIEDSDSIGKVLEVFNTERATELIDRMLYSDLMTRMPDHLLAIGDRMSMAHSLEARPVLVDREIVDFAAAIPARLKLKRGELKYVLKRVAARYLPKEVLARPKQGFTFPLGKWMRTDLRKFLESLAERSRFVEHGIFDAGYVRKLTREHLEGRVDHNYRLWILINLEFWYRSFIDGETLASQQERIDALMS